jgi:ABC-type transport system involved in Fe-S cluster assembly fused permease/ATPase subunit
VAAIGVLYGQKFFWIVFGCVSLYMVVTIVVTEWRAKFFKRMAKADA